MFVIKEVKQFHGHVIVYANGEKVVGNFYEKELQNTKQN